MARKCTCNQKPHVAPCTWSKDGSPVLTTQPPAPAPAIQPTQLATNNAAAIAGKWPGGESEKELLDALKTAPATTPLAATAPVVQAEEARGLFGQPASPQTAGQANTAPPPAAPPPVSAPPLATVPPKSLPPLVHIPSREEREAVDKARRAAAKAAIPDPPKIELLLLVPLSAGSYAGSKAFELTEKERDTVVMSLRQEYAAMSLYAREGIMPMTEISLRCDGLVAALARFGYGLARQKSVETNA